MTGNQWKLYEVRLVGANSNWNEEKRMYTNLFE